MNRRDYEVYSAGRIGPLTTANRWIRSGTADVSLWRERRFTEEDIDHYRTLAASGLGAIVVCGPEVLTPEVCEADRLTIGSYNYDDIRLGGIGPLLGAMREASHEVVIIAQLECNALISGDRPAGPSAITSPYFDGRFRELDTDEISAVVHAFAETALHMKAEGFDAVQLHAAHGGGLWHFLSPHANKRTDSYGGSPRNRVRIVQEIIERVRKEADDFPVLVKANCVDYLEDGIDREDFHALAAALEAAGVDAIEVSGGTWDCLLRSEEELGFRPVPAAESQTGILDSERQAYFLAYVEGLELGIPIILVGGVRNVERSEEIIQSGAAQFVSMCRPLIREPELVARWRDGLGPAEAACRACNSCIYSMHLPVERLGRGTVTCLPEHDPALHAEAQRWLTAFVDSIRAG